MIILITFGILSLYKIKQKTSTVDKIENTQTNIISNTSLIKTGNLEIDKVLQEYSKTLISILNNLNIENKPVFDDTSTMSWTGTDHISILINNSPSVKLDIGYCDDTLLKNSKSKIVDPVGKILIQNGYKKSASASLSNYYDLDYYGYEKGDIKCNFIISSTCSNNIKINFICSDQYQNNYQNQSKILRDLGIKNQVVLLDSSHISGNYAYFNLGYDHAIAIMDDNGKWNLIAKGQDVLSCDLVNKYNIPKSIVESCYDNNNHKEKSNTI